MVNGKQSIELVGASEISWEEAANSIIKEASETLEGAIISEVNEMDRLDGGCRRVMERRWVAEVKEMDIKFKGLKPVYRVKVQLSLSSGQSDRLQLLP